MSYLSKLLVSIGMIFGFIIFLGVVLILTKSSGRGTFLAISAIFFFGLVAGLKAVWKKKETTQNQHLDKS
jgi:hypothetical protein